jgi:hypothetical protein
MSDLKRRTSSAPRAASSLQIISDIQVKARKTTATEWSSVSRWTSEQTGES